MKQIIKKFLVLCCVISGMFLVSNKCFADNYNIKIVLIGKTMAGKTNIVNRLCGREFDVEHRPTRWNEDGMGGIYTSYSIGNDTFTCYFYDAPGLLRNDNIDVDQQLKMIPRDDISLVLVVIDPLDRQIGCQYRNPICEACDRCLRIYDRRGIGAIIVVNKSDTLNPMDLQLCEDTLNHAIIAHTTGIGDNNNNIPENERNFMKGIIVSAKTNVGIDGLKNIIKEFLRLNRGSFNRNAGTRFKICAYDSCPRPGRLFIPNVNDNSKYCSRDCILNAEGFLCLYEECSHRRNGIRFLMSDGGIVVKENGLYCCERCHRDAEGQDCANGKDCPNFGKKKFLPHELKVASKNKNSNARYCSEECRHKKEDGLCSIM